MNKANETAILVATEYLKRIEKEPMLYHFLSPHFEQRSYAKTAAREVLDILVSNPSVPPLQLIEDYKDEMNEYSCINSKTSTMFSVAYDIADDIINELIKAYK